MPFRLMVLMAIVTPMTTPLKSANQNLGGPPPPPLVPPRRWLLYVSTYSVHILKGKDGSSIDFMALTMIDPASSWLEVVELPTITRVTTKKGQR